jgi:site-specific recombinase XerD
MNTPPAIIEVYQGAPVATVSPLHNPVVVYLGKQSPAGRSSLQGALRWVFKVIGGDYMNPNVWGAFSYEILENLKRRLQDTGKSPATINHALSAVRGVLRVCKRMGIITRDLLDDCLEVENIKHSNPLLTGREVSYNEVAKILTVCRDGTPAGIRDSALVAFLWGAGLRRHEVAALKLSSVDMETGRVIVEGKGSKTREVFIAGGALGALCAWVAVRGEEEGALFGTIRKNGVIGYTHMTPQAVYTIVEKRRTQAGVTLFTPHDLRRSYVGNLLQAGADINTVGALCGHADINTTARYDRRNSNEKKRVASFINTPFV